jgi:hypothetical protein
MFIQELHESPKAGFTSRLLVIKAPSIMARPLALGLEKENNEVRMSNGEGVVSGIGR